MPVEREVRHEELRVGYRVPRGIMDLANLLLARIAPDLAPTEPVREAREEPRFDSVTSEELADAVAIAVAELIDDERSVGVVVPSSLLVAIRGALAAGGIPAGDISTDQLEKRVTLLSATQSKGLEFDRVVVVEPMQIVTESGAGWSELYVAMSRATQQLVVVHALPLPSPLPGGVEPSVEPVSEDESPAPLDSPEPTLDGEDGLDLDLDLDFDLTSADPGVRPIDDDISDSAEPQEEAIATPLTEAANDDDDTQPAAPATPARNGSAGPRRNAPAAVRLGGDFSEALVMAKLTHDGRTRRGTAVSYMGHLLGTVALVLEDGGSETEAIAALLHDAVEDGAPGVAETIRARFGDAVAGIVLGCTDPVVEGSFRDAKIEHLRRLEDGSASVRRVALAEKLDNARALLRDLERYGADTWRRMDVDADETLWYLCNLVSLFRRTFPSVLVDEFDRTVGRIEETIGRA
jgi:hypothetical protein